jgi:SAM-dependent methyltransferase
MKEPTLTAAEGFGTDYAEWKHWDTDAFGQVPRYQRHYFPAELKRCGARPGPGARVLDIGFGHGTFLACGRSQGWHMHGTEANPQLVQAARAQGFDAVQALHLQDFPDGHFDLVSAFDVLEHVPQEQLLELLSEVRRVLKPGAAFVARFPNADSPFGLALQHGDVTHVTAIGRGKVMYLAQRAGARVHRLGGEVQPLWVGWSLTSAQHLFAAPVKWLAQALVRAVWLPHSRIDFWAANTVVEMRWPAPRGDGRTGGQIGPVNPMGH